MAARRYRARRSAAAIAGIAAVTIYVAAALNAWQSPDVSQAMAWTYVARAIVWAPWSVLGVLIAARGVRTAGSTMLATAVALIGFNNSLEVLPVLTSQPKSLLYAINAATALVAARAYLRSSQLFPRALTEADVLSPTAAWRLAPGLQPSLAFLLRPWASWAVAALWLATSLLEMGVLSTLATVAVVLLGGAYWRTHMRVGNATVRHRVTWILQCVIVFAMLFLIVSALMVLLRAAGVSQDVRAHVFVIYSVLLAIGGCGSLAMAVFSAGAFNPSFVVRSTVVYGAAISLLLFALNVITSVLVDSAVDAFGLSDRIVAAALGALAGICVEPLAKGLRRLLEKAAPKAASEGV